MRWLLALVLCAGCGSDKDGGDSAASGKHSFAVADASALPTCDDAGEGWVVYVTSDAALKVCASGEWQNAPLAKIEATWDCPGSSDLISDGNLVLKGLWAQVTKFTSGDYFMSCMAGYDGNGDGDTTSSSSVSESAAEITCLAGASLTFTTQTAKGKWFDPVTPANSQEVSCTKK